MSDTNNNASFYYTAKREPFKIFGMEVGTHIIEIEGIKVNTAYDGRICGFLPNEFGKTLFTKNFVQTCFYEEQRARIEDRLWYLEIDYTSDNVLIENTSNYRKQNYKVNWSNLFVSGLLYKVKTGKR